MPADLALCRAASCGTATELQLALDVAEPGAIDRLCQSAGGIKLATPLGTACMLNRPEAVRVLIANGCDPNIPCVSDTGIEATPIIIAAQVGSLDLLEAVLAAPSVEVDKGTGLTTALHRASEAGIGYGNCNWVLNGVYHKKKCTPPQPQPGQGPGG